MSWPRGDKHDRCPPGRGEPSPEVEILQAEDDGRSDGQGQRGQVHKGCSAYEDLLPSSGIVIPALDPCYQVEGKFKGFKPGTWNV